MNEELRRKMIELSEKRDIGEFYSEELGEKVYYLKLSTKDGTTIGKNIKSDDIVSKLLAMSLCDKEGNLLFKASDIGIINKMSLTFTKDISEKILKFNKMIADEELEKN